MSANISLIDNYTIEILNFVVPFENMTISDY